MGGNRVRVVLAVLAFAAGTALPATKSVAEPIEPPDPVTGAVDLVDDFDTSGLPAGFEAPLHGGPHGPGYALFVDAGLLPDGYVLRLVDTPGIEDFRAEVQNTAAQLAAITGISFQVAAGTIAEREPNFGEITIEVDNIEGCNAGGVGCGGPIVGAGPRADVAYVTGGRVWIRDVMRGSPAGDQQHVVSHEVGHTMNLHHFDEQFDGAFQVMNSGARWDAQGQYQNGDQNGLHWVRDRGALPPTPPPTPPAPVDDASARLEGDFNGDGRSDVAAFYDYGSGDTAMLVFDGLNGLAGYSQRWRSGVGNWLADHARYAAGDFNGDGRDDIAALYNYENSDTAVFVWYSNGAGFNSYQLAWRSGAGNWDWHRTRIVASDVNGDRIADLAALYNYGNADSALFVWSGSLTGLGGSRPLHWRSGAGNWTWENTKIVGGDFDGDGVGDIAALYMYSFNDTAVWLWRGTLAGTLRSPVMYWRSGAGMWEWGRTRIVATDMNGDLATDIVAMYAYTTNDTALFTFNGSTSGIRGPSQVWRSGAGNWEAGRTKLVAGDFNGDLRGDVAGMYSYSFDDTALWVWQAGLLGGVASHGQRWRSGVGNFQAARATVA